MLDLTAVVLVCLLGLIEFLLWGVLLEGNLRKSVWDIVHVPWQAYVK